MTRPNAVQFVLVPDSGAARRIRRALTESGPVTGVVVGVWSELIEWARRCYFDPTQSPAPPASTSLGTSLGRAAEPDAVASWDEVLEAALSGLDAFWSDSYALDPEECSGTVEAALVDLIAGSPPGRDLGALAAMADTDAVDRADGSAVSARARAHLDDLIRLHTALDGLLPPALAQMHQVLESDAQRVLHPLRVVRLDGFPDLSRWQSAIVDKLNADAADAAVLLDEQVLFRAVSTVAEPASLDGAPTTALGLLAARLYQPRLCQPELWQPELRQPSGDGSDTSREISVTPDDSVQWVGARDFLQEAEVAVGMAQRMLAEDAALSPADIGLLLPDSFEYATVVDQACKLAGLQHSGLALEHWRRDLGREAVFHFLYCRQRPAPTMAVAVCLASPLMPWSREEGAVMAQAVMDGDFRLRAPVGAGHDAVRMVELLSGGDTTSASLIDALSDFVALLSGPPRIAQDPYRGHVNSARDLCRSLFKALGEDEINWARLRRLATPRYLPPTDGIDFNLEGLTVWRESHEPWRAVRRLIVLGFNQGHYPAAQGASPVFLPEDVVAISRAGPFSLTSPLQVAAARRQRLCRQLAATSESVSFLISRRDPAGARAGPSESLVFMAQLLGGVGLLDELVHDLDSAQGREHVRHLAISAPQASVGPRSLVRADLNFGRDLLELRRNAEGHAMPESPSGLETMMASPLAWLLRRLKAEPTQWAPDTLDVALLGTLAHAVFEALFRPDAPWPAVEGLNASVEEALEIAARRHAPFLQAPQWRTEWRNLVAETTRAARVWRDLLAQLDARILASEVWLQGRWHGVDIHGQADLVLGVPDGRVLVVDYKRSGSAARRQRMAQGFDSQARLYLEMLHSASASGAEAPVDLTAWRSSGRSALIPPRLSQEDSTGDRGAGTADGIVYYMLNDQIALSDSQPAGSEALPGWRSRDGDVAIHAMDLIAARLEEVRTGLVPMNRADDELYFERVAKMTPYALSLSPLIALFTLPRDHRSLGEDGT